MNRWLLTIAGRVYVWAVMRYLHRPDLETPLPPGEVRRLAQREVDAIPTSILAHFDYQDREQRILSDRLTRRFDLGQALNEAAARAITEKQTGAPAMPVPYPTEKQKLALKVQEETLQERIRKS
jgi:hypothetical protein